MFKVVCLLLNRDVRKSPLVCKRARMSQSREMGVNDGIPGDTESKKEDTLVPQMVGAERV